MLPRYSARYESVEIINGVNDKIEECYGCIFRTNLSAFNSPQNYIHLFPSCKLLPIQINLVIPFFERNSLLHRRGNAFKYHSVTKIVVTVEAEKLSSKISAATRLITSTDAFVKSGYRPYQPI